MTSSSISFGEGDGSDAAPSFSRAVVLRYLCSSEGIIRYLWFVVGQRGPRQSRLRRRVGSDKADLQWKDARANNGSQRLWVPFWHLVPPRAFELVQALN